MGDLRPTETAVAGSLGANSVADSVSATTKQADAASEAPAAVAASKKASTAAAVISAYIVNEINHRWGYDPKDKQRMMGVVSSTPMEGLQATIKKHLTAPNDVAAVVDDIEEICIDQVTKAGVDRADAELLAAGVGEQICGAVLYYMEGGATIGGVLQNRAYVQ